MPKKKLTKNGFKSKTIGLIVLTFQYILLYVNYILLGSRNYTAVTFCIHELIIPWSIQEVKKKMKKN